MIGSLAIGFGFISTVGAIYLLCKAIVGVLKALKVKLSGLYHIYYENIDKPSTDCGISIISALTYGEAVTIFRQRKSSKYRIVAVRRVRCLN